MPLKMINHYQVLYSSPKCSYSKCHSPSGQANDMTDNKYKKNWENNAKRAGSNGKQQNVAVVFVWTLLQGAL